MEWLLFTYWLPPEPSRKRVYVWRQLKKMGALSVEGTGWFLPKSAPSSSAITDLKRTVEELEGTANLFTVTDFGADQQQRTIAKFQAEREREYSEIMNECRKVLKHIEREYREQEFTSEEVEELEGDLEKINRWLAEAKRRDFWESAARKEVEKLMGEVEASLAAFTQKAYEEEQKKRS